MGYDVNIKEEPDELVASVRRRIEPERIGEMVPEAFERLMGCVAPDGIRAGHAGARDARHA